MELSLVRGIVPRTVFGLTAIAAIILIIGLALSKSKKRGRLHPLIVSLIAAVLAGAAGLLVAWLVSDVFMVFGVSLGWPVIFTIAGGIAGVGFVIAAAVTMRGARRVLAIVLVPLVLLSTALGVDSIYGEYQTIGTLVGYTPYASLGSIEVHKAAMSVSDWRSKAQKGSLPSMPSQGKVLTVDIPNAKSNFTARKAMIYLPPAALSDRPPALPVMELLAGQPGSPSRLIDAGNIAATMNAYAAKHDGLAPIVLVPDQNGEATHNSLCADTTQGNAETYLTTDVVNWAKKMLPVAKSARMWAMVGSRKAAPAPRSSSRVIPKSTARCCRWTANSSRPTAASARWSKSISPATARHTTNRCRSTPSPPAAHLSRRCSPVLANGTRNRLATCARSPTPRAKPAWRSPS